MGGGWFDQSAYFSAAGQSPGPWLEPVLLEVTDSTNDVAARLAALGCPEGQLVVAREQLRGRGRLGRTWSSGPGGLWFSMVLRPVQSAGGLVCLPLVTAVGVAEAIQQLTGLDPGLKWPNDLLVGGRKLAGILHELGRDWVVAGVGLNANQPGMPGELKARATSIYLETGAAVALEVLLGTIAPRVMERYHQAQRGDLEPVLDAWRSRSVTLGRPVVVTTPVGTITGAAEDIDDYGRLLVRTGQGLVAVAAGDIGLEG